MSQPLWQPSPERVAQANLSAFLAQVRDEWELDLDGYADLYRWSIEEIGRFWTSVWDFGNVIAETRGEVPLVDADKMPGARFFPEARLELRREPAAPARRR